MRYKLLGKSGLRVSELCLGTMTFGEDWGWGASKEESQKIFDYYAETGGNFIDTSVNYTNGTSEKFLGEFTKTDRSKPGWQQPQEHATLPRTQPQTFANGLYRPAIPTHVGFYDSS